MKSNSFIILLVSLIVALTGFLLAQKLGWTGALDIQEQSRDQSGVSVAVKLDSTNDGPSCEKFQYMELHFSGELGESLRVVTSCKLFADKNNFLKIPFQHIFTFPPQSGEFTTQIDTKIYIKNHQSTWSKKWKLAAFYFSNSDQDRVLVLKKNLNLDVHDFFNSGTN